MPHSESSVAPYKDRLAACMCQDAYALLKVVKAGDYDINVPAVKQTIEFLQAIEKELENGKSKQTKSGRA